jgi:hypothetical protein
MLVAYRGTDQVGSVIISDKGKKSYNCHQIAQRDPLHDLTVQVGEMAGTAELLANSRLTN